MLLLSACSSSPKYIDDDTLKSVFFDLAMHDAVMAELTKSVKRDTTCFFNQVLQKNGVTIEDFEYTLEKKMLRKSNVLPSLINELTQEVAKLKSKYNYNAQVLADWDKRADTTFARTLYLDSMYINDVDSIDNTIIKVNLDATGELKIRAVYTIDTLDKNRSHSMNVTLKDTISGKLQNGTTRWFSKYNKNKPVQNDNMILKYDAKKFNQAIVTFLNVKTSRKDKKLDTPYVRFDTLEIKYHYPKLVARQMLIDSVLNINSFKRKITVPYEKKDSSALSTYLK